MKDFEMNGESVPLRVMGLSLRESFGEWADLLRMDDESFELMASGDILTVESVMSVVENLIDYCSDWAIECRLCIETAGETDFSHRAARAARALCERSGFGIYTMPQLRTVKVNLSGVPIHLEWELVREVGEWARASVTLETGDAANVARWRAMLLAAAVGREDDRRLGKPYRGMRGGQAPGEKRK